MDILLDTHLAYWYIMGEESIPLLAKAMIEDPGNFVFVSLVSAWEIGLKHNKHPQEMPVDTNTFIEACREVGFTVLPVVEDQLLKAMEIETPDGLKHADPFDRFLLGTASALRMRFLSHDHKISLYQNPYILFV